MTNIYLFVICYTEILSRFRHGWFCMYKRAWWNWSCFILAWAELWKFPRKFMLPKSSPWEWMGSEETICTTSRVFHKVQSQFLYKKIRKNLKSSFKAASALSSLINSTYSRLFDSIITLINSKFTKDPSERNNISLCDLPGFKSETLNSYDSLCNNYRAEKIQYEFLRQTLTIEQEKYINNGKYEFSRVFAN